MALMTYGTPMNYGISVWPIANILSCKADVEYDGM
jgi:hypothetical protein